MEPALAFAELSKTAARAKPLAAKQQREMEMWHDWKNSGEDPEKLQPLLESYQPLLQKRIRLFQGKVPLPPQAINTEFNKHFLHAVRTYDPNRGAQLNTYVHHHLRAAQRFINKYQNAGRIPENRIYKIGPFQNAQADLTQKLGRPPTSLEMADEMGWNPDEVKRMESELSREELLSSGFTEDPTILTPSRDREALRFLQYDLDPNELIVYEHLLGVGGKPTLSATQIAKKLNWSDSKVSRIRKRIAGKAKQWDVGY